VANNNARPKPEVLIDLLIFIQQPVLAWSVPPAQVERLRQRFPHLRIDHALDEGAALAAIQPADAAFTWKMTPDMVARAERLRWVHTSAVAVGTLPLAQLAARGIAVSNSRGIQSVAIAEHVIAMLLALSRQLPLAVRRQSAGIWAQNEMVGDFMPWLVEGRRMGIVGLGTIGQAVAVRAAALGLRVTGIRRRPERGAPPGVNEVLGPADLDRLLATSDVLVLAAPWTSATDRLLGEREMQRMKRGAILINVARGQLVDEDALTSALAGGHLGGAALDVFAKEPLAAASPLWSLPNVLITPHTSGFRADHWNAVIDLFSENLRRFEAGEPLLNLVDCDAGY
jgi:phosphoglycerate dehydrogenase-like enzyme